MAVTTTNLGVITAYGDAVAAGYTGTKAEWQALMASYATVGQQAVDAKNAAVAAKDTAVSKATEATTAANTATTKASEASASAQSIAQSASQIQENSDDIAQLKKTLVDYNCADVFDGVKCENATSSGVTCRQNTDGSITLSGTATKDTFFDYIVPSSGLPSWFELGKKYYVKYSGTAWFRLYKYVGTDLSLVIATKTDTEFLLDSADRLLIRITVDSGKTYNETVHPHIFTAPISSEECGNLALSAYREITNYKDSKYANDANNFTEHGAIFVTYDSANTEDNWKNMPKEGAFWLACMGEKVASVPLFCQIAYPYNKDTPTYKRVKTFAGWGSWEKIGTGVNNTFNTYESTYNITATPQITTDSNAYLAPTGDSTDVTASIASMLSTYGVCRLGKGNYFLKNLVMPEGTMLVGSGTATKIYMLSGDGCAIKMSDYSVIKDLMLIGGTSMVTPSASVRNRHAILWAGTYAENGTAPHKGLIDSVYIRDFEGGGITCQNTGYGNSNSINVTNCYIQRCDAGININYWSEFNRFTGIKSHDCYYGCVNNGGNNMFVNCDFSANKLAFLMDNENNQSPNNSHGSAVGCIFNHTDNNSGIGIKILNCDNGFVFSGCQIFFSQIDIEDSEGVVISNCNFGDSNCNITVKGGGTVLFIGNMHQAQPTKTISGDNVHFVNCYVRTTGEAVV